MYPLKQLNASYQSYARTFHKPIDLNQQTVKVRVIATEASLQVARIYDA